MHNHYVTTYHWTLILMGTFVYPRPQNNRSGHANGVLDYIGCTFNLVHVLLIITLLFHNLGNGQTHVSAATD